MSGSGKGIPPEAVVVMAVGASMVMWAVAASVAAVVRFVPLLGA